MKQLFMTKGAEGTYNGEIESSDHRQVLATLSLVQRHIFSVLESMARLFASFLKWSRYKLATLGLLFHVYQHILISGQSLCDAFPTPRSDSIAAESKRESFGGDFSVRGQDGQERGDDQRPKPRHRSTFT